MVDYSSLLHYSVCWLIDLKMRRLIDWLIDCYAQSATLLSHLIHYSVCWFVWYTTQIATLSLLIDYSSLIHYSVCWLKMRRLIVIDWLIDCYAQSATLLSHLIHYSVCWFFWYTTQSADWRWDDWLWLIDWLINCYAQSDGLLSLARLSLLIDWLVATLSLLIDYSSLIVATLMIIVVCYTTQSADLIATLLVIDCYAQSADGLLSLATLSLLIDWLLHSVCWLKMRRLIVIDWLIDWLLATLSLLIDYSSLLHYSVCWFDCYATANWLID